MTQTVRVQLAIQEQVRTANGSGWADVPPIILVPVMYPSGGGYSITLPLKKGDEGMLIFCDRCIDTWWQNGQTSAPAPTVTPPSVPPAPSGSQRQNEIRAHYLHDCGFYPGLRNQRRLLNNYSSTSLQVRRDDGTAIVDVAENTVTLIAEHVSANTSVGTPQTLMNDTAYQWFQDYLIPWAVTQGFSDSPPFPAGGLTTVLKGQ